MIFPLIVKSIRYFTVRLTVRGRGVSPLSTNRKQKWKFWTTKKGLNRCFWTIPIILVFCTYSNKNHAKLTVRGEVNPYGQPDRKISVYLTTPLITIRNFQCFPFVFFLMFSTMFGSRELAFSSFCKWPAVISCGQGSCGEIYCSWFVAVSALFFSFCHQSKITLIWNQSSRENTQFCQSGK